MKAVCCVIALFMGLWVLSSCSNEPLEEESTHVVCPASSHIQK